MLIGRRPEEAIGKNINELFRLLNSPDTDLARMSNLLLINDVSYLVLDNTSLGGILYEDMVLSGLGFEKLLTYDKYTLFRIKY